MRALTIWVEDRALAAALAEVLAAQDMAAQILCGKPDDKLGSKEPPATADLYIVAPGTAVPAGVAVMHPQCRMGAVVDRLRKIVRAAALPGAAGQGWMPVGPYRLVVAEALLRQENGPDIRLTEKERDLLVALYRLDGGVMDRRTLLADVWGYAAESETHTVETHIYRLRQKIEKDPAAPEILLTDDNGYRLCPPMAE